MKIIHLVSAKVFGGGEVYVLSLAKEQIKHGHTVEIICTNRPVVVNKFRDAGFKVHVMQIHGHFNPFTPLKIARLFKAANDESVIHVHRATDTPIVCKGLNLLPISKRPRLICTHHLIEPARTEKKFQSAYGMIDKLICVSEKSRTSFLSSSPNINPEKVCVILNSTNRVSSNIIYNESEKTRGINLLYMGRIVPEKGIDTIIDAISQLPETNLIVCGTGKPEYIESLKNKAVGCGVDNRINWVGFANNIEEYLSKTDIAIIPSRWEEPCALVNFEYMAAGIPMITSNTGGQPEIIDDGVTGLLVNPDNPAELADAIFKLSSDPQLRNKISKASNRKFVECFTYDRFYDRVMSVYNEL